jgi:predicted RNA-binding Zn-ribbon protein involved in translation (DUF1610 family)
MEEKKQTDAKHLGRTPEGSNVPPVRTVIGVVIGIMCFFTGLVLIIFTGYALAGIVIGIPLLIASFAIPYAMLRGTLGSREVHGRCPHCDARIETQSHIRELECPACHKLIRFKQGRLLPTE